MDSTTGGPIVRLGTKWPSMTSRCRREAPPRSTRAISSARRAKSADRIEGTISTMMCGLIRFYHSGVKAIPLVAARQAVVAGSGNFFVFFRFEGAGGVDEQPSGGQD